MLSWSHYCELLKIEEPLARSFYEQEGVQNNWSVRELKRQINAMLFERLALSKDTKTVNEEWQRKRAGYRKTGRCYKRSVYFGIPQFKRRNILY